MATLDIQRIHSIDISAHESGSWLAYLTRGLGFQHVATSTPQAIEKTGTRKQLLAAGDVRLVVQEPVHAGSPIRRFLEKHPEGISCVNFLVSDARATEEQLLEKHATCTDFLMTDRTERGEWKQINIATPLGDVEFAFVQTADPQRITLPGTQSCGDFDPAKNPLGITEIDHLTSNVRTLMPVIAFYEHVLGLRRVWDVRFHTEDVRPGMGAGLTSVAMRDVISGIRFVNNEPLRPRFDSSQVQMHVDTNRGPGLQQIALGVGNLVDAVGKASSSGVQFLPTPPTYYQLLPRRLAAMGVSALDGMLDKLAAHGILVDGDRNGHILQIFCRDQATQFGRPSAGPLLIEMIERRGCQGFGEGNFRAIFEATSKMQRD